MAKYLVTLAILCIFGAVIVRGFDKAAAIADFMGKAEACKTEVGAKDADLGDMVAKKPASTPEGKCLRACIMKKYEVMDATGKFVPSVATKHAEMYTEGAADKMKIAQEIIDACAGLDVSGDPCEAAAEYCKCFKEQAVAHGIPDFQM